MNAFGHFTYLDKMKHSFWNFMLDDDRGYVVVLIFILATEAITFCSVDFNNF